ncbi:MAG: hypothetical protein SGPRY_014598, partial [Prymnesium sp.]
LTTRMEELERAIALSRAAGSSRPVREAARQARQAIDELAIPKLEPIGQGSDASDPEEEEEGEGSAEEEKEEITTTLSEYELQRQQNIAANREQLALLGLLGPETPLTTERRGGRRPHSGRERVQKKERRVLRQPRRSERNSGDASSTRRRADRPSSSPPVQSTAALQDTPTDSEHDEEEAGPSEAGPSEAAAEAAGAGERMEMSDAERTQLAMLFRLMRRGFAHGETSP